MNTPASHYPVVIVGAGPTGLTLANLLRQYGVRFLLVERNLTTVQEPRAVSIDDESLRILQTADVIDTVLPEIVPGYGSIYYSARRVPFAQVEPTGTPYGYPRRNAFRQPVLEAQLRAALGDAHSSTLFGWELRKFSQHPSGVEMLLEHRGGGWRTVSCDYLIGCDGAASTVRSALDIPLEGTTYAMRWLIIDLENSENSTKHTEVFCNPRRPCITLPGPHRTRRYEFEMRPRESDTEILEPQRIHALLTTHGADPNAVIRRKAVYRFHARVANRWRVGRVFLAGDAAHLTPPFAGQGMNSGLRDAYNLAWKLAAVTSGRIGPTLLQTYEQERRDHVWQMIRLALRMGRVMSPSSRWSAWMTQLSFRALNLWPPARDYITQMKYKPQPRFLRGFMVPDRRSARQTLVGRMLPQPTVLTRDGRRALLDDEIGSSFVLLVRTSTPETTFAALDQPVWDRLRVVRVAVMPAGSTLVAFERGIAVAECDDGFATALGADRDNMLLVRPDRYVAACFSPQDADAAASTVQALLDEQADRERPQAWPETAAASDSSA